MVGSPRGEASLNQPLGIALIDVVLGKNGGDPVIREQRDQQMLRPNVPVVQFIRCLSGGIQEVLEAKIPHCHHEELIDFDIVGKKVTPEPVHEPGHWRWFG